ncbi:MAG: glycosyltransferase [Bacteroidales bacterium]|nr:glycosyltransferase [Bacteroidales bacterium]
MPSVKISVVIITYNEEQNIKRCLESIMGVADEVVVLDSYSTDNTREICESFDVVFEQRVFTDYIDQKNTAIAMASNDVIMSLDADEALSEKLKESILRIKENWRHDGYYINRLTNYCGKWIKHTSWYPDKKLRLWDRRKGKWEGIKIHEKVQMLKGTTTSFLKGELLHYSYYSINQHLEQIKKFSDLAAQSYFKEGQTANYFTIFMHPLWRFIRDFIIKGGFLDRFYGLIICINAAHETFLKYVKLRELNKLNYQYGRPKICFFNSTKQWGGGEKWHFDISHRIFSKGYETIVFTNRNSELFYRVRRTGLRIFSIRVSNLSFLNIFKVLRLSKIFKRERIKTIIINLSSDLKLAGIAAKIAGVPNIIYRRGSAVPVRNTSLNRYLFGHIVTQVIANSDETRRTILVNNDHLINPDKIKVIYNGIDLNEYQQQKFRTLYEKNNGEIVLGNAGRLSEEKGHIYLIELARILKDKNYNFKILIAGKGKMEAKLRKYAKALDVEDKVFFMGFVDNIKSFNKSIDVFVLTSLYEGFGYVMVEAMAVAKPVVAFDIKSSGEIVENNHTGYIVKKADVDDLANAIEKLINNRKQMKEFGENGLKRVEEVFNIEKTLKQVEELIQASSF